MEYSKIISVTGLSGLFELLSSKGDGAIVRSLDDKSTRFVSSRVHNFSHLESIEIFTVRDNVNLADVFLVMQKSDAKLPSDKDNAAVKKYFETVYPDIDFERVYTSDMKKMVKWLQILTANNVEIKAPQTEEELEEPIAEGDSKEASKLESETTAPKAAPKKKASNEDAKEEKAAPKKKATTRSTDEKDAIPKKKAAPKKKEKE
ncbi:MAG TPA: DUF5606 domain-containing protein [Agriterribacter sp.]|nr:DUF5606 domain-containing protein [Agriterribacter sp.]